MMGNLKPYPAYKDSGVEWLEKVPAHWEAAPVKRHYDIQLGKMLQTRPISPNDIEVPYLKAQHVQWFSVRTSDASTMWASPRDIQQFGITAGDLLVCEGGEGGRCGIVKEIPDGFIIQNALHRVRPRDRCRNDYLQYTMSVVAAIGWFDALTNKATIAHFTREKFGALCIPIPSPDEQAAIVHFLDWAEHRLRRLIRARQRRIKLLEEYKQALIHQAVTGQIDVRTGKPYPAYKDSGVEWLGKVPAHWETCRLKSRLVKNDSGIWRDHHDPVGTIVLRSTEQTVSGGWKIENPARLRLSDVEREAYLLQVGDLVVTKSSGSADHIGKTSLVTEEVAALGCVFSNFMQRLRLGENTDPKLIWYYLNSPIGREQLVFQSTTTTGLGNLNGKILGSVVVALPSLPEQTAIAEYLDAQTAKIDAAIAAVRREIELLREYRERLIADVVTGKVDVREVAERLPDEPPEEAEWMGTDEISEAESTAEESDAEALSEEVDEEVKS